MTTFPRLLRRQQVEDLTGLSTSSLYRKMRSGDFPAPIDVGSGTVRWREDELAVWLESRPRAKGVSKVGATE